ncbi:hypothetical protein KUCAC02_013154, partial [Chaenocephalus aceratus]
PWRSLQALCAAAGLADSDGSWDILKVVLGEVWIKEFTDCVEAIDRFMLHFQRLFPHIK